MDTEVKKVYQGWEEKNRAGYGVNNIFETIYAIDRALIECENQLSKVGLGIGYTSNYSRLDRVAEDKTVLYNYIHYLPVYVEDKIDRPLSENFRLNATERISRIRLEDFEIDNNLGVMEKVCRHDGTYGTEQKKSKINLQDFMGILEGKIEDGGSSYSVTTGCVEEFAEIFESQYDAFKVAGMLGDDITFESYWEQLSNQGEFYHDGSGVFESFVSSVLDITIIKPVIESCIGTDLVTGEDLSELERGLKAVFAVVDLITLGGAVAATNIGKMGAKEGLKILGKTAMVEFASNTVACGVGTLGEAFGWPVSVTMLLSLAAGVTVSVSGTNVMFKGMDGDVIRQIDLNDVATNGQTYNQEEVLEALRRQGIDVEVEGNTLVDDVIGKISEGGTGVGNIAGKLDTNNIPNMTKQDIIDSIPDDWNYTEHNGFVHIRDADGNIRIRIDPPDKITNYPHVHVYDSDGNLLDSAGNIVDRKSPDGHIPYKDN